MSKQYIADKETLDKVYSILSADQIYGFIEHNAILSPTERIEYIGANANYNPITITKGGGYSLGDWADFPVLKANKPYMVRSDGTPDYRLNEENYALKEDGTASDVANTGYDGGAYSWLMKIYKKEYMAGDDRYVLFSMTPKDGFEPVGFVDPDNKELEGAWIPMFYGSVVNDGTNDVMRSLSGLQPGYSRTAAAEHTAITNAGARHHHLGGPIINTIIDLLIMWGKSSNTQAVYGNGNMSGYDASLTPTMGVKQNAVIGGGQFFGTSDGKSLNKILHSIVLGSWQQWQRDPYTLLVNGRYKVSKNYTYDLTGANYTDTGISLEKMYKADETQNTGVFYPHKYQTIQGFGAVPVQPYRGSSSTGGCDGLWQNVDIVAVALRFGYCSPGAHGGARCLYLYTGAGDAAWYIGASDLLLPPEGVGV